MKITGRRSLFLLIGLLLPAGAALALFLLLRPPPGNDVIPYKFGGRQRGAATGKVELSGLKLPARPEMEFFVGVLREFATASHLELRGGFATPDGGAASLVFRAAVVRPGVWQGDFQADCASGGEWSGTGEIDLPSQRAEVLFRGEKLAAGLSAVLKSRLPDGLDLRGSVAEFTAKVRFSGENWQVVEVGDFSGRLADQAGLSLPPFRLERPVGRFLGGRDEQGRFNIKFPDSSLALGDLTVYSPAFLLLDGRKLEMSGEADFGSFPRLGARLPFRGEIDVSTRNWKFSATGGGGILTGGGAAAVLDEFTVQGSGGGRAGKILLTGAGPSLTLPFGRTGLWAGAGPRITGEISLQADPAGQLRSDRRQWRAVFDRLTLTGSVLTVHCGAGEVSLESVSPDRAAFRFTAATLEGIRRPGTVIASDVLISGTIHFSKGRAERLTDLKFSGGPAAWQDMNGRLQAETLAGALESIDLLQAPEQAFQFSADFTRLHFDRPDLAGTAAAANWCCGVDWRPAAEGLSNLEHTLTVRDGEVSGATGSLSFQSARSRFTQSTLRQPPEWSEGELENWEISLVPGWRLGSGKFNWELRRQSDGLNGTIQFRNGRLDRFNGLTLSGIDLDLPISPAKAGEARPGSLKIAEISGGLGLINSLQAELRATDAELAFRGRTGSGFFAGNGFFFTGSLNGAGDDREILAEFGLPTARLTSPVDLAGLLPALPGPLPFSGRFGAAGSLRLRLSGSTLELGFDLDGETLESSFTPVRFRDLKGTLQLPSGGEAVSRLNFSSFAAGPFRSGDGELELRCREREAVLSKVNVSAWGGLVGLRRPVRFSAGEKTAADTFELTVDSMRADELFSLPEWRGAVDQPLSGSLTLRLSESGPPVLLEAELAAVKPGKLRLSPLEGFRQRGLASELMFRFGSAVWREFDFSKLKLIVRRPDDRSRLRLEAEGRPSGPVPFVYAGESFRAAEPGEHGFDGFIEIGDDFLLDAAGPAAVGK